MTVEIVILTPPYTLFMAKSALQKTVTASYSKSKQLLPFGLLGKSTGLNSLSALWL